MTTIRLYDSMTRTKRDFVPLDPKNVRLYLCGPTVYERAHIGNARAAVVGDVLFRLLRHVYGHDHVTYARNITDIDDKIMARARETGRPINAITAETTRWYQEDMEALGCLPPTHQPRATENVTGMVAMIEALIARKHAYLEEGHVLFAVDSFADYGRLSGRSVDDMIAGARVEVAPYKKNPMDFVLWKPSAPDQPGWDSPWGRGRPGWHIECSAMSRALLGPEFDIHAGGSDLLFPHHENEIAQSRCAEPDHGFARYWVHNGMVQVEGKKMSKSLGNFFTVQDKLAEGVPGEVMRYCIMMTKYREKLDWNIEREKEAEAAIDDLCSIFVNDSEINFPSRGLMSENVAPIKEVIEDLLNDIDTPSALRKLRKKELEAAGYDLSSAKARHAIVNTLSILGINVRHLVYSQFVGRLADQQLSQLREAINVESQLRIIAQAIDIARKDRDYKKSDAIRQQVELSGAYVSISRSGTKIARGHRLDMMRLQKIFQAIVGAEA